MCPNYTPLPFRVLDVLAAHLSLPGVIYNLLISPQENFGGCCGHCLWCCFSLPNTILPFSLFYLLQGHLGIILCTLSNSFHLWLQGETMASIMAHKHSWYTCNKEGGRVSNCEVKWDIITSQHPALLEPLSGPRSILQNFHPSPPTSSPSSN